VANSVGNQPPAKAKSKSLIQLETEALEIEQRLLASDGEIDEIMETMLTQLENDLSDKAESYAIVIKRLESASEHMASRRDEYQKAQMKLKNAAQNLKDRVKATMLRLDKKDLGSADVSFKLSRAKPVLVIENEDIIPNAFKKIVTTEVVDKDHVRAHLELGMNVDGAMLLDNVALRINVKGLVK
jgi:hypothetical protein